MTEASCLSERQNVDNCNFLCIKRLCGGKRNYFQCLGSQEYQIEMSFMSGHWRKRNGSSVLLSVCLSRAGQLSPLTCIWSTEGVGGGGSAMEGVEPVTHFKPHTSAYSGMLFSPSRLSVLRPGSCCDEWKHCL